jgi:hypothetical protein
MSDDSKFRAKVLRGLARALADERSHLLKYERWGTWMAYAGSVLVVIALLFAFNRHSSSAILFVALGVVGGILMGLSIYFSSAVKQWPVLRRFLDAQAVKEAAARDEGA